MFNTMTKFLESLSEREWILPAQPIIMRPEIMAVFHKFVEDFLALSPQEQLKAWVEMSDSERIAQIELMSYYNMFYPNGRENHKVENLLGDNE